MQSFSSFICVFVYRPPLSPPAFSLLTLRGEMRHARNLLADNEGQLFSLLKPFMSWISSASLPIPFPHLAASTPTRTYSKSPCTRLCETCYQRALFVKYGTAFTAHMLPPCISWTPLAGCVMSRIGCIYISVSTAQIERDFVPSNMNTSITNTNPRGTYKRHSSLKKNMSKSKTGLLTNSCTNKIVIGVKWQLIKASCVFTHSYLSPLFNLNWLWTLTCRHKYDWQNNKKKFTF